VNETRFIKIPKNKPADFIFGPSGAVAYAIGDMIEVLCRNGMTKEVRPLYMSISFKEGFLKWVEDGVLIQEAMPTLDVNAREALISGIFEV